MNTPDSIYTTVLIFYTFSLRIRISLYPFADKKAKVVIMQQELQKTGKQFLRVLKT